MVFVGHALGLDVKVGLLEGISKVYFIQEELIDRMGI